MNREFWLMFGKVNAVQKERMGKKRQPIFFFQSHQCRHTKQTPGSTAIIHRAMSFFTPLFMIHIQRLYSLSSDHRKYPFGPVFYASFCFRHVKNIIRLWIVRWYFRISIHPKNEKNLSVSSSPSLVVLHITWSGKLIRITLVNGTHFVFVAQQILLSAQKKCPKNRNECVLGADYHHY